MTRLPNKHGAHIVPEYIHIEPKTREYVVYIRPTGFLMGVAINPQKAYMSARCYLEEHNGKAIPGTDFSIDYAYTSGGIILENPLINMSAVDCYRLHLTAHIKMPDLCDFIMYPIGCWERD